MSAHPTMAFRLIGRIFVIVHTEDAPSAEDFQALLTFIRNDFTLADRRCLVVTPGPAPSAKQREAMNNALREKGLQSSTVAIVTPSAVARGAVTALSWFNRNIRSFPPQEMHKALEYLEMLPQESAEVGIEVRKMQAQLTARRRIGPAS